jgi:hypothetical protein
VGSRNPNGEYIMEQAMVMSDEINKLLTALDGFHNKSPLVKSTKENPFHKNKYADYNTVVSETRQHLVENGLRVKQAVTTLDGKVAIWTMLVHLESMQYIQTISIIENKPGDPQSQGSGITYMKRYSYIAILDLLVDADDDGNLGANLGKQADKNEKIEKAILQIQSTTNATELKDIWKKLGDMKLTSDKRVYSAKEEHKKGFEAE